MTPTAAKNATKSNIVHTSTATPTNIAVVTSTTENSGPNLLNIKDTTLTLTAATLEEPVLPLF